MTDEDKLQYDVVIVGAGPAGLSAAIRLKQLAKQTDQPLSVVILEKGAHVGAHILSGAVLDPKALNELLPDWATLNPPSMTAASQDSFCYLTPTRALPLPVPGPMRNQGNYIVSLSQICAWLAGIAESMDVDILPGFAASECLFEGDRVVGVKTGDKGLTENGERGPQYEPGVPIYGKLTLFAEGCRGECSEQLIDRFKLRQQASAQTYGLGIKELWKIPKAQHQSGLTLHTVGWPLDKHTYGGGFVYHAGEDLVSLGFVTGLDYSNPYTDPFQLSQQFKTHPSIKKMLIGGERIAFGARALNEGGFQSIPQCHFPGGAIIGCAAGFMNVPRIKGTHTAMKSAIIAAELTFESIKTQSEQPLERLNEEIKSSWLGQELYRVRNVRPGFKRHLWLGLAHAAIDHYLLRGRGYWTWRQQIDHQQLQLAKNVAVIHYPKPDNIITFDKLSSVYLTATKHREGQPKHLKLADPSAAIAINWEKYASPEQYYCPANVYEIIETDQQRKLQINAANCIHCKSCDIKDPTQNIRWHAPEGGDGPQYTKT